MICSLSSHRRTQLLVRRRGLRELDVVRVASVGVEAEPVRVGHGSVERIVEARLIDIQVGGRLAFVGENAAPKWALVLDLGPLLPEDPPTA